MSISPWDYHPTLTLQGVGVGKHNNAHGIIPFLYNV